MPADEIRHDKWDYTHQNWQDWGDPTDIEAVFVGRLQCSRAKCQAVVAVSGLYGVQYADIRGSYTDVLRVRTLFLAVPLFETPPGTPGSVASELLRAAQHIWLDPGAAATSLRRSLEALLTEQGVPTQKGPCLLRLHQRILLFRDMSPEVGDLVEAVKWVGNDGTHASGSRMTADDVLDTAEMIEVALGVLYATNAAIHARAARIVAAKTLVP
ncbi:DUF4145 domain-containing protein [Williamsia deligens]|uniref:DUF4145 domain-containing protein n=1 Tax=Williamsia deligens TaxID=321325 RepID=A0ABW3G7R2_9NOCA|nr:DUF4145 domain-containing protein [Williamsia deligens]